MTQCPDYVLLAKSLPHHLLGGMEVVAWDLARAFARTGAQVEVITTDLPGSPGAFVEDGVRVLPLKGTRPGTYSSAWWRQSREAVMAGSRQHARGMISVSAAGFGALSARPKHVPFLMQAHGTSWSEIVSKFRTRKPLQAMRAARNAAWLFRDLSAYRQFDAVVAIGGQVAKDLRSMPAALTLPASKVRLIDNGVDTTVFRPDAADGLARRKELGLSADATVVFTAARLHGQKGVARCLRAIRHHVARDPGTVYLIAGEGPERGLLESQAARLGIARHVRFLGRISRDTIARTCRASDVFLFLTERVEGLPMNVLEAWATGLPLVLSNELQLGAWSAITNVDGSDSAAVSDAILASRQRRIDKAWPAAEFPLQHALPYCASQYQSLLAELASQLRRPASD